jgi:hypothetical protein
MISLQPIARRSDAKDPNCAAGQARAEVEQGAMTGLAVLSPILPPPGSDEQMFGVNKQILVRGPAASKK